MRGTWLRDRMFGWVHGNQLVYNACWEDPRLDRQALALGPDDDVLVITSAGCNALDYLLDEPAHVYAVDVNPRQNALLDLKVAGVRSLEYEDFLAVFGRGGSQRFERLYRQALRPRLAPASRDYWDQRWTLFAQRRPRSSFYFRGAAGSFAWAMNRYIDLVARVRDDVEAALAAPTLAEQQAIYFERLKRRFWSPLVRWLLERDATLSMLGVPRPQRAQIDGQCGGVAAFVESCIEAVFAELPLADNYFWRVYLTGEYAPGCCPEYLTPTGFDRLKRGLIDRVSTHTTTVTSFLCKHRWPISRFVLLDHMDWMAAADEASLAAEWQAIVDRASPRAICLWRSAGLSSDFVDRQRVEVAGARREVGELLDYDRTLAARLHGADRVHTYASFHIAHLAA